MIICPNCGHETEKKAFCIHCGNPLESEATESSPSLTLENSKEQAADQEPSQKAHDEQAVTETPSQHSMHDSAESSGQQPLTTNQHTVASQSWIDKLKIVGANFSHFFITLLKRPGNAKDANSRDVISSIISLVIYALLLALGVHLALRSIGLTNDPYGGAAISFVDSFVVPLIAFLFVFLAIILFTFLGTKIMAHPLSFYDVISKYGAYLIPFFLLYIVGFLLAILGTSMSAAVFIFISMTGILVLAPTFILLENPDNGFNRFYLLLIFYVVTIFLWEFLLQTFTVSLLSSLIPSSLDQMKDGF